MTGRQRLTGWKVLAAFLGKSERWVKRQARGSLPEPLRLPVWRMADAPNAPVEAYVDELQAWEQRRREAYAYVTRG